jgi:pyrroloquinoline quinone biosynthesis protein B
MIIRNLGAGAGGGVPQWNCGCPNCAAARSGQIAAMTQSSVAVSAGPGEDWLLLNASPDLRQQLAATPALHPRGLRDSPVRAVVVTNADVDHIAGLLTLREKTRFRLYATPGTLAVLAANTVFRVLDPDLVEQMPMQLNTPFYPLPGLEVTAFAVPGKIALFLEEAEPPDTKALGEQTVALRIVSAGRVFCYVPGCADLPDWLCERLAEADLLLFDGTIWADDDMPRLGAGPKTGARMGHLAMQGPEGSLARLTDLRGRRVYTHINNTNPVLDPQSPERAAVIAAGWQIAADGMEIEL